MIKILKQCPAFIAATQNTLIKVAMNSSIAYLEFHNYRKKVSEKTVSDVMIRTLTAVGQ